MAAELPTLAELEKAIFSLSNADSFSKIALQVYNYQYQNNPVYRQFCQALNRQPNVVNTDEQIPFLPIRFFKNLHVVSGQFTPEAVFRSSGTTGTTTSRHFVKSTALYEASFLSAFEARFGPVKGLCILGLLPSYLEQGGSSLVYMVDRLITLSGHPSSGFYLRNQSELFALLKQTEAGNIPVVLFGVSYALLDFGAACPLPLRYTKVIETGGMKGRRKEMTKDELYGHLRQYFQTETIYAEYGMTELLSQAYAVNGNYKTPPWMKVLLREETDPLNVGVSSGVINVTDLANLHSCSFIATDDRGRLTADGFEVLGRMDNSDVRGCSQLI